MTRGEWTLVLFVFGLVYSAGLLVRFGEWFGERVFRDDPSPDGPRKAVNEPADEPADEPPDQGGTH